MIKQIQKIVAIALLLVPLALGSFFVAPRPADAQLSIVMDLISYVWDAIKSTALNAIESATNITSITDTTLKDIAIGIAKQMLQQLTLSVVDWINHGFNGGPAFVANPSQYFKNLGDDIAGNFLQQNGNLKFLCSPFSLDVRVALAVKMQNNTAQQYTCTLSSAIKNATNAAQNASITGFVQGDFSQGGWPAFLSLTTDPQNNAGGAYLKAESDLTAKINAKIGQKTNELAQGLGFMSKETCTYTQTDDTTGTVTNLTKAQFDAANANNTSDNNANLDETCTTQTPGSVISGVLNKHLGVPTDELLLANDLNAIISAAFSQLVVQVFNGGLGSVTAPSGGSGSSYLQALAAQSSSQFQSLQASSIQQLTPYLNTALQNKANIDNSIAIVDSTKANLNVAVACWSPYAASSSVAQAQVAALQSTIATQITPVLTSLNSQDANASSSVQAFLTIQNNINTAQTTAQLNAPSLQISALLTGGGLVTQTDAASTSAQVGTITSNMSPLNTTASTSLQQCHTFIANIGT